MESDEFSYIKNCEMLNPEAIHALRSLVTQYPYYQTARLLLVKNMCNNKNPELGYELQKASLFAADRSVLFYMTEGDKYRLDYAFQHGENKKADVAVASKKKGMDRTSDLINDFLVAMPDDQPHRRLTLADATTDAGGICSVCLSGAALLGRFYHGQGYLFCATLRKHCGQLQGRALHQGPYQHTQAKQTAEVHPYHVSHS